MTNGVYLKDYKEFVKVDSIYYGGDQSWLFRQNHISKFWADRSCGVIAACNTLIHMSKDRNSSFTIENFTAFAMDLYPFIKPKIYGIPTLSLMVKGLSNYAQSLGLELIPFTLIKPTNILMVVQYIKKALKNDYPIMMLTLNTKIKNLQYHWVTITGYYQTHDQQHYITTSNWGTQEIFSLNEWVTEKSFYKGLLYFTMVKQINIANQYKKIAQH